jgi:hypothetical protein
LPYEQHLAPGHVKKLNQAQRKIIEPFE